jgi:hypothetical protein
MNNPKNKPENNKRLVVKIPSIYNQKAAHPDAAVDPGVAVYIIRRLPILTQLSIRNLLVLEDSSVNANIEDLINGSFYIVSGTTAHIGKLNWKVIGSWISIDNQYNCLFCKLKQSL